MATPVGGPRILMTPELLDSVRKIYPGATEETAKGVAETIQKANAGDPAAMQEMSDRMSEKLDAAMKDIGSHQTAAVPNAGSVPGPDAKAARQGTASQGYNQNATGSQSTAGSQDAATAAASQTVSAQLAAQAAANGAGPNVSGAPVASAAQRAMSLPGVNASNNPFVVADNYHQMHSMGQSVGWMSGSTFNKDAFANAYGHYLERMGGLPADANQANGVSTTLGNDLYAHGARNLDAAGPATAKLSVGDILGSGLQAAAGGALAGGGIGAALGGLVLGPVGAVVGGIGGAVIGGRAGAFSGAQAATAQGLQGTPNPGLNDPTIAGSSTGMAILSQFTRFGSLGSIGRSAGTNGMSAGPFSSFASAANDITSLMRQDAIDSNDAEALRVVNSNMPLEAKIAMYMARVNERSGLEIEKKMAEAEAAHQKEKEEERFNQMVQAVGSSIPVVGGQMAAGMTMAKAASEMGRVRPKSATGLQAELQYKIQVFTQQMAMWSNVLHNMKTVGDSISANLRG